MKSFIVQCFVFALALAVVSDAAAQIMPLRLPSKGESRTWKSADGAFSVEARLVGHTEDSAILERKDGKEITVPLKKLSDADQFHIAEAVAKATVKPEPAPMPRASPSIDPSSPFDAQAVVRAWSAPDEPFKLNRVAGWKLDKVPDQFELSLDGETVYAAYYAEAKHLVYRAKDGELLHTIEFGTAPLTASAISPNGKVIVATIGKDGAGG